MKHLLVTGGAGFIGSNFVRHYFEAHPTDRVTVVDKLTYAGNPENIPERIKKDARFRFWYGDVCNAGLMERLVSRADVVVHMAAESHVARSIWDDRIFFETDVLGTQSVASAIAKNASRIDRFIHISTSEVYGTAESKLMDEEHPLKPRSPYASAKAGADRLVYSYLCTYDLPAVIVRPFNNYGPFQHLEKAVPRFITSAILGEPLTVHGDGRAARDWLYVEDHAEVLDRLVHCDLKKVRGEVVNLGTGRSISIGEIARIILEAMGRPTDAVEPVEERLGQVHRHTSSTEKAERLLGWKAKTRFEEGILRTIDWYRSNDAWWRKLLWMRHIPILTADGEVVQYY